MPIPRDKLPMFMLRDLKEAEYTDEHLNMLSAQELFDCWLQWIGIIGFSNKIWTVAQALIQAEMEAQIQKGSAS